MIKQLASSSWYGRTHIRTSKHLRPGIANADKHRKLVSAYLDASLLGKESFILATGHSGQVRGEGRAWDPINIKEAYAVVELDELKGRESRRLRTD
jgi:hypothetical protein